jgi:hypothetical protein
MGRVDGNFIRIAQLHGQALGVDGERGIGMGRNLGTASHTWKGIQVTTIIPCGKIFVGMRSRELGIGNEVKVKASYD